jgi:hypothetical protein
MVLVGVFSRADDYRSRTAWEAPEPFEVPAPSGPAAAPPPFFRRVCAAAARPSAACLQGAALIHAVRAGDCSAANALWVEITGAAILDNGGKPSDFRRLRPGLSDLVASCR